MTEFTLPDPVWEQVQMQILIAQHAQQQVELTRRAIAHLAHKAINDTLGVLVPEDVVMDVDKRGVVRFLKDGKPVDLKDRETGEEN